MNQRVADHYPNESTYEIQKNKKSKLKSEIRSIFLKINFCDWSAAAVANQRRVAVFLADTVTLVFLGNTHTHGAIYHRYPVAGIESAAE